LTAEEWLNGFQIKKKSELVEMKIWPLLSASMKAEKQLAYGIL